MREKSLRRMFDNYVRRDPLNPDLRHKVYTAVAAKLARIVFGLTKSETDYRPFFEHSFQVDEPSRRGPLGRISTP